MNDATKKTYFYIKITYVYIKTTYVYIKTTYFYKKYNILHKNTIATISILANISNHKCGSRIFATIFFPKLHLGK